MPVEARSPPVAGAVVVVVAVWPPPVTGIGGTVVVAWADAALALPITTAAATPAAANPDETNRTTRTGRDPTSALLPPGESSGPTIVGGCAAHIGPAGGWRHRIPVTTASDGDGMTT